MTGDARELFAAVHRRTATSATSPPSCRRLAAPSRSTAPWASCATRTSRTCWSTTRAARRTFVVAPRPPTRSSSEWLIRGRRRPGVQARGLPAGLRGVRARPARPTVEALQVLLTRPSEWSPAALTRAARGAHRGTGALHRGQPPSAPSAPRTSKASGRHHLDGQARRRSTTSPLLTAEERVNAAVAKVTAGRELTRRRSSSGWSTSGSTSSRTSRSTARTSRLMPILSDHGGWGRANRVFDGQLDRLVADLNRGAGRRMTDVVGKLWGYLPRPAPRRHGLRRLHRAADLPALPQDGRRARHRLPTYAELMSRRRDRAIPATGPTCASSRAPSWPSTTRRCLRTLGKQHGILGDIFAGAQNRFTNPVNLSTLIGLIDETEWTSSRRRRQGGGVRGTAGEGGRGGQEGRRPVLHAARC